MRKFVVGLTLLFLALLALDAVPVLRGGAGWQWPYALPADWTPAVGLAALLLAYLLGVWVLRPLRRAWPLLLWGIAGGALLGFAVTGVRGAPLQRLFTHTVAPVQTGYSTVAVQIMARDGVDVTLRRWPQVMRESFDANLIHLTTSPPGQALLHYWAAQLLENTPAAWSLALRVYQCSDVNVMRYTRGEILSAGLGMLMPVWSALTVLPLYAAARTLSDDSSARRLLSWWPLVPSALLFAPTWNTFYPFLVTCAFALLAFGLQRFSYRAVFAAGLVMSAATFMNFAVLPALLLFGLYTLGCWFWLVREKGFRWPVLNGLCFGAGLISVWALFWLYSGLSPLDIFGVTLEKHALLAMRAYLPWLLLHPYDVLMFAGWPLVALFFRGVWAARRLSPANAGSVLALAVLATLLLVDLSGIVRGENARILIFYVPFLLLAAVLPLAQTARGWDLPLLAAQALTVLVMAAVLAVVPVMLNPPPAAPRTDLPEPLPAAAQTLDARFDAAPYAGAFVLRAYRFIADPAAQAITLELYWDTLSPTERPYQFEVMAVGQNPVDGEIIAAPARWYAQNGNYLPTCWSGGQSVRDRLIINLPPVSDRTVWQLGLRAVDERTGSVMTIALPDGAASDTVSLGPVNYP
ncbi:MAG: hypothetical protein HXY40_14920 [Chloroflexi bacterium]|nr:hypothetical protein [Chloroflexota bacterium]